MWSPPKGQYNKESKKEWGDSCTVRRARQLKPAMAAVRKQFFANRHQGRWPLAAGKLARTGIRADFDIRVQRWTTV
jgi:hypothetical protein